jgi:glutamate-1-semialdehyde 2,1-aminomutase
MFREEEASEYDWPPDHELYDAIATAMQPLGAMPEPDSREPWFFCAAHADEDVTDRIPSIFAEALDAVLDDRARTGTALATAEQHHG